MSLQAFKENDPVETKMRDCFLPALQLIDLDLDEFKEGAFEAWPLGQVLYNLNASPLADQVNEETFVQAFYAIHGYFKRPGTFEFYLEICRVIWGEDVSVEFVVPSPGRLQINIEAAEVVEVNALVRAVVNNAYVYDELVDTLDEDNILFQIVQGPKTQSEVDALFFELSPAGIFVEVSLTIT